MACCNFADDAPEIDSIGGEDDYVQEYEDGEAQYTFKDGHTYDGQWKSGRKHGKGKETWPSGMTYEGDYENGLKHGQGVITWETEEGTNKYEGDCRRNALEGKGTYTFSDGRKYDGDWVRNRMHGEGTFNYPNGNVYTGEYVKNFRSGAGKYEWKDGEGAGRIFEGQFRLGKQHGFGLYTPAPVDPVDKPMHGQWKDGTRIRWVVGNDPKIGLEDYGPNSDFAKTVGA